MDAATTTRLDQPSLNGVNTLCSVLSRKCKEGENGFPSICWGKAKLGHRPEFRKYWYGCMEAEFITNDYATSSRQNSSGLEEVDQQSVVLSLIQKYPKFSYKDTHCLHKSSPVSSTPSLLVTCISNNIASTGSSCVSVLHVCEKKKCI
ncbi:uncharacterized protein LOC130760278 isoform X2 [Actinidia eriantha]|uniref:uncharacterized protein LOC130760278 isoform X2 n=1 Tax=Actinidia eriantha TaxID=165200 RepID=UPI00258A503D|nr:uncharacterized protein LOC130760278 isoform X2 [Actinidia eriantha]